MCNKLCSFVGKFAGVSEVRITEYGTQPDGYSIEHTYTNVDADGVSVKTDASLLEVAKALQEPSTSRPTVMATYVVDGVATQAFKI